MKVKLNRRGFLMGVYYVLAIFVLLVLGFSMPFFASLNLLSEWTSSTAFQDVMDEPTSIAARMEVESSGSTLALLDPRLIGGFRNQHMRLTGLVIYAQSQNMKNLLLDSLRFDNYVVSSRNPSSYSLGRIPFQSLFDVDHWNAVSDRYGSHILPRLVRYSPQLHPD
jgi:hypothetical protein